MNSANPKGPQETPKLEKTSELPWETPARIAKANNTRVTIEKEFVKELLDEALALEVTVETKTDKAVDKEAFNNVINDTSKEYNCTPAIALAGVFATLQAGGTSNNKRSNVKITLQGYPFESKKVNAFITKNCKGVTPRQFAKCFSNEIFICASKHNITGNAYTYLRRFHASMLTEAVTSERFWCADFQIDNSQCPEYIRKALQKRYADKFRNNRQS